MKKKGLYIVSEKGCLTKGSGACNHIEIGVKELNKYFDVNLILLFRDTVLSSEIIGPQPAVKQFSASNILKGSLKDIFLLFKNHKDIIKYYRLIKSESPAFIYERGGYLNFNGLIISKLLKIPHFYEVNGVMHNDIKVYYKSFFNSIIKNLLYYSYKKSNGVFYIGGINKYLGIKYLNSYSIQNGIDETILLKFSELKKEKKTFLKIVFIGHVMQHHGLDFYCEAIKKMDYKNNFEFIFIGKGTEVIKTKLPKGLSVKFLGEKSEEELCEILMDMDIGIIPSTFEYGSNMKLFLYGAAKLCVIAPDVSNLIDNFNSNSLLYFEKNNVSSLSRTLDELVINKVNFSLLGQNLHFIIKKNYTWSKIFKFKEQVISSFLN